MAFRPQRMLWQVTRKRECKMNNPLIQRAVLAALLLAGGSAGLLAQIVPGYPPLQTPPRTEKPVVVDKKPGDTTSSTQDQPTRLNKASSLIGTTVKNQKGEDLGKIRDVVIDFKNDRVAYCVLGFSSGKILSAEKFHAVPLQALQPGIDGGFLILNVDKESLARSEGFDKATWPSMAKPAWGAEIKPLTEEKPAALKPPGELRVPN